MAKRRCESCGKKVGNGFDFCPYCGARMADETVARPRKSGRAFGCAIAFFIMVALCAVAATVWLVREHDSEEALRLERKHRADSVRAIAMMHQRREREREDSLKQVADSAREAQRIEAQLFTLSDFLTVGPDGVAFKPHEDIVATLRERGYHTLHRDGGSNSRRVVMGLNAEMQGSSIAGKGAVYSVAGLWPGRVELMFSAKKHLDSILEQAHQMGFSTEGDGVMAARGGEMTINRRKPLVLEISRR